MRIALALNVSFLVRLRTDGPGQEPKSTNDRFTAFPLDRRNVLRHLPAGADRRLVLSGITGSGRQ